MNSMKNLAEFLELSGALHDAVVDHLTWSPCDQRLELTIADIYANFEGLPEYPGAKAGTITLVGVINVQVDFDSNEQRLNIHDFNVEASGAGKGRAKVTFWPSGRLEFDFNGAECPAFALKQ